MAASTPERKPAPRRHWAIRLLGLVRGVLLTLLLVELGLRLVGIRPLTERQEGNTADLHPDPAIAEAQKKGWIPWPRSVKRISPFPEHPRGFFEMRRNNLSCREDEDTLVEKPQGTYRILVIGDSHTDGACFNSESYANLLESRLAKSQPEKKIEVINTGFGPSSPYQQLWAYERVYRKFQPDHIVVAFYSGNDLMELLRTDDRVHLRWNGREFVHAEATSGEDTTRYSVSWWGSPRRFIREYSSLYAALARIPVLRRAVRSAASDEYRERLEAALEQKPAPVWQGLNQAYYFQHHGDEWGQAERMTRHILERYRQMCAEDQIGMTLIVIPTLRQIDPAFDPQLANVARTLELSPESLACDERACELICRHAQVLQLSLLDVRSVFSEHVKVHPNEPLYFKLDHHMNLKAHELTAEELERRVEFPK